MIEQHLPDWLLARGPWGLDWWQWVAVPLFLAAALALGAVLSWVTRLLLGRITARTATPRDDELIDRLRGPLTILWASLAAAAAGELLELGRTPEAAYRHFTRAAFFLALFWGGFRAVNVLFAAAGVAPWARQNPSLAGVLPLFRKIAKFTLLVLGAVAVLNEIGFQVGSLLAGLGIGGIAVALAAQKTLENFFGSMALGVDQPFRVGDLVKVEEVLGTVESIGMRSTRFRTMDRTLVTIPNGRLADLKAETYAARDRLRLFTALALVRTTRADQMRRILGEIEAALRGHPQAWPDGISVRFVAFAESSLTVEVQAWFRMTDWDAFTAVRQELYLRFMEIVEAAGTRLAFPTRTVVQASAVAAAGEAERSETAGVGKPGSERPRGG